MRFRDFWRSAASDNIFGFRFVLGMCLFWAGPLLFAAIGVLADRGAMVVWSVVAAVGWALAWAVMLIRHFNSIPGDRVNLTPTLPMIVPAVLMVGGTVGCLMSF
ncbi:hypothetical protein V6K52_06950 [Knoellia sp. S7-12]|uniref:hypothetical protein n=1 Tax=Knoellia sp. S7-12 TaxID=3126698 RepID=UPI0033685903